MVIRYAVVLTDNWRDEWGKIDTIFGGTLYIAFRLSLLHTVADRFMEIFFNVKYPLYMSIKKLNALIVGSWLLALVFSFICLILRLYHHWMTATKLLLFTVLFLDVIIFVSACGTYSFFFLKVRTIRKSESSTIKKPESSNIGRSPVAMTLIWKKFKLPCYIVLTYIFFNFTATLMLAISYIHVQNPSNRNYSSFKDIAAFLDVIGFASDSFIYVFVNKNVRKQIHRMCRSINT